MDDFIPDHTLLPLLNRFNLKIIERAWTEDNQQLFSGESGNYSKTKLGLKVQENPARSEFKQHLEFVCNNLYIFFSLKNVICLFGSLMIEKMAWFGLNIISQLPTQELLIILGPGSLDKF